MQTGRLILASGSVTRAGLLHSAGLVFEACVPDVDESAVKMAAQEMGASVEEAAFALAEMKARSVDGARALVIGADQILVCEGAWFDKPASMEIARHHLTALRGRAHELVTAVVCVRDGVELLRHVSRPRLVMRSFSDAFLEAYLYSEGSQILQSVGAYRLEGLGQQLFDRIEGEHSAVLGLPLLPLFQLLRETGMLLT